MAVILEGLVLAFWLVLICVVCLAKGPAAMSAFYEKDVQQRVVELGLGTEEQVKAIMEPVSKSLDIRTV